MKYCFLMITIGIIILSACNGKKDVDKMQFLGHWKSIGTTSTENTWLMDIEPIGENFLVTMPYKQEVNKVKSSVEAATFNKETNKLELYGLHPPQMITYDTKTDYISFGGIEYEKVKNDKASVNPEEKENKTNENFNNESNEFSGTWVTVDNLTDSFINSKLEINNGTANFDVIGNQLYMAFKLNKSQRMLQLLYDDARSDWGTMWMNSNLDFPPKPQDKELFAECSLVSPNHMKVHYLNPRFPDWVNNYVGIQRKPPFSNDYYLKTNK